MVNHPNRSMRRWVLVTPRETDKPLRYLKFDGTLTQNPKGAAAYYSEGAASEVAGKFAKFGTRLEVMERP